MKRERHSAIRDLLVKASAVNQDDLRRRLASQGIHVTQATLSRDIRELKLLKGPGGYELPADLSDEDEDLPEIREVLQSFGLEVLQAMNLLVLHTIAGAAQPVAAVIDGEEWDEVVGTIAGDNTVLIICPDVRQATAAFTRLEAFLA